MAKFLRRKNTYAKAGISTSRDGTQIGESAMIVIDSKTGEYEKIEVMGKLGYKLETISAIDG